MGIPTNPEKGDKVIDASGVKTVDLTSEQIAAKAKLRDGYKLAIACLQKLEPEKLKKAGINGDEIKRCVEINVNLELAALFLPPVEKLAEMLKETKIEDGHQISMILSEIAGQVKRRAERDPGAAEVLGALEDLFTYVSGPANKAVATKAKLASQKSESQDGAAKPEDGAPAKPTEPGTP